MAGGGGRSLQATPTWAVALVCLILVAVSIILEHFIHLIAKWLAKQHKRALFEALEKIKAELMLLGFISLLLTVLQGSIANICVPESVGNSWLPCEPDHANDNTSTENVSAALKGDPGRRLLQTVENIGGFRRILAGGDATDKCAEKGKVALISNDGIHQLHIFIFVLAIAHIMYCIIILALGRLKMRKWKAWESETKTAEYQFSHDPARFRFARDTSFGRRHLNFWSKSPILIWIVCFFRQFLRSVPKVDYLTLRHGFITAHLAQQSWNKFDFQKYIKRSLEEDFKVVVGISPTIWFFAVLFLLSNTHGAHSYLWLPFIPLIIILLVGAKLQVIITKMAIQIMERGDVVRGVPVVQPTDDLFWFSRPRFLLFLIHFVLFQNAFQLAFFAWTWYEFSYPSCFHRGIADILIRISMGVLIQVLCSYVTLPLYALVTQMGSNMRPTIFNERVATALRKWHQTARKHLRENKKSGNATPQSPSRPSTPTHNLSPVHLLQFYRSELDSSHTSPRRYISDDDQFDIEESALPPYNPSNDSSSRHHNKSGLPTVIVERRRQSQDLEFSKNITKESDTNARPSSMAIDFSFDKRQLGKGGI